MNNKFEFKCEFSNINEFQIDLMNFLTNYLDNHNKKIFFQINVNKKNKFFIIKIILEKIFLENARMFQ